MTRFWMVARKPSKGAIWGNPRMRHYDRDTAVREAKRLANMVGEPFVILGCEETIVPDGAEAEPLRADEHGPSVTVDQKALRPRPAPTTQDREG